MSRLRDVASVIRSKNSGPFEITFDVMFADRAIYETVKKMNVLNGTTVCRLYNVVPTDIVALLFFDPAMAFKFTLRRNWPQGSTNERDTFGAQQHVPLMNLELPDFKGDAN